MGDKSHEASVASPKCHMSSEQVRVVSPCWHVNQLLDSGRGGTGCVAGLLVSNACALSSSSAVLGDAGAALAPVLGFVSGGVHKVKSVNCLVEALASPKQRQIVVAACSRKGRGRPAKFRALVDAGSDIVNASLTDSDIQGLGAAKKRGLHDFLRYVGSSGVILVLWEGSHFVADSSIVARHYVVVQGRWIPEG
ncbi:hypothetical protein V6N12_067778 [Hibiscus sabdariffa]|uniref:Uncharacterized protein n=1 Tax=Hibiscus sabdariffa TaxID=183260 RepID=A0ABR2FN53_9ROSI